ncbi:GNAT family N-acetyltransferase [Lichenicoccus sp.]|uniref:GNAT family N-acetyltransferase n=1 Tax=Lichenicoccus sp. TaxID=2781899 RepID=UPI003D0FB3A4
MKGNRTTVAQLLNELSSRERASLLVWRRPSFDGLFGCVWLEPEDYGVWFLSSLTVDPREQNAGLGRKLLTASEARAQ